MKKYILMIVSSLMFVSCLDTIILPNDKTVDEDFWKTKSDVSSMVNAAYAALATNDVITRFIVWGDFRSDELVLATSPSNSTYDALAEIAAVNMQTTNTYASWASLYAAINKCNIVLERAEEVMAVDPNYTLGDYQTDRSQMLALRALCYFYLVRNFRDVPYVDVAYMNSSQNTQLAQSSPVYVLGRCIEDLEEASKTPLSARGFTTSEWQRVGWMTNDGINALLADIYLWRASVTHNAGDYQQCIDYCDKVIESKRAQHIRGRNEIEDKAFPLADGNQAYLAIFGDQNAEESILELQMRSNLAVCQYLFKYENNRSGEGYLKASTLFGSAASKASVIKGGTQVFSLNDLRYYASCYGVTNEGSSDAPLDVRKMISISPVLSKKPEAREAIDYGALNRNYILYRLTDVMLMKAEALVQQVDTTMTPDVQAALLREPFTLVQAVNTRSLYTDNLIDSMKWSDFSSYSKENMELLVMEERLRELCFEGKRWYDLLRYNYRHIDYSTEKYDQLLADQNEAGTLSPINADMKTLMVRSRGSDATGVSAKMRNEAYLYLPVPNVDMIVCPLLRQNPAYKNNNEFEKNY